MSSSRPSRPPLTAVGREEEAAAAPEPGRGEGTAARRALDRAIVCDVLARREGAVAAAWRHFVPFVERVLGRLARRGRDTDDLTQEVFERFFRKIDELRNPDAVRPFLYGIALRVAKRDLRYRWLRRDLEVDVDCEWAESPAADPETREAARRLVDHLGTLKPEQRSLLVARYVEGMDLREVASAHGLSFNTMRRRLERAWHLLERRIDDDDVLGGYLRGGGEGDR
jgi:RNA polymerase sigma-70 factor (ECF subfamily)